MSHLDKQKFITNVLFFAIIFVLGYGTIKYLAVWLAPFVAGLALALILQKPISWVLKHTRLNRRLVAPVITLIIIVALLALIVLYAVGGIVGVASNLPGWFHKTAPLVVNAAAERLEDIISALPVEWEVELRVMVADGIKNLQGKVGAFSAAVLAWAANSVASFPSLLVGLIITIVATFFLSADFDALKAFIWRQIPGQYKTLAGDTWSTFARTVGQMIRSYLLIMLITFCELVIGFVLLRVDYAVLLAVLIAAADIMPIIGTGTILIPWGLIALLTGDIGLGVGVLLLYLTITVIRNIIEPRIVGRRIGVHPLVTLVLMYLGLRLFGVPGLFLLPVLFILLKNAQEAGMIALWK